MSVTEIDLKTRDGVIQGLRWAAQQVQHEYPVSHDAIVAAIKLLTDGLADGHENSPPPETPST